MRQYLFIFSLLLIFITVGENFFSSLPTKADPILHQINQDKRAYPNALKNGKIFTVDGTRYMYGGKDDNWKFNIDNSILKEENFHFGLGRETFPALIHPQFISLQQADKFFYDHSKFLLLNINGDVRAYSITLLTHHEIVNDIVGGDPIMAAYCILADLGAIYNRTIGGQVFTFALSGYTYYEKDVWNGLDGFVFWDRETESLWWPLIGKAVSGPLLNVKLEVHNKKNWEQTTWRDIKSTHKSVKVLAPNQSMITPQNWPRINQEKTKEIKQNLND